MALIDCPECGKEISDKAPSCLNCGVVIATDNARITSENFKESKTEKLSAIVYGFWKFILYLLLVGALGAPVAGLAFYLGLGPLHEYRYAEEVVPIIGILIAASYAFPLAWRIMYRPDLPHGLEDLVKWLKEN